MNMTWDLIDQHPAPTGAEVEDSPYSQLQESLVGMLNSRGWNN